MSAGGDVVVHLAGGTELRLGVPTDLKQKMTVAADIIQEYLRDGKTLEYVDASAARPGGCQGQMKVISCVLEGMSGYGAYCRRVRRTVE